MVYAAHHGATAAAPGTARGFSAGDAGAKATSAKGDTSTQSKADSTAKSAASGEAAKAKPAPPAAPPPKAFSYTFIVFQPGEFTIGSVNDEPDRRKNEVRRHGCVHGARSRFWSREITFEDEPAGARRWLGPRGPWRRVFLRREGRPVVGPLPARPDALRGRIRLPPGAESVWRSAGGGEEQPALETEIRATGDDGRFEDLIEHAATCWSLASFRKKLTA